MRFSLASVLTLHVCGVLIAFEPVPARSYTKPTADGRHALVMLVPRSIRDVPNDELRARYGQPGFYRTDDPKRPVWICDWYVQYESGVVTTNDGEFVVRVPDRKRNWRQIVDGRYRVPPRPPGVEKWAAAVVYRNGQLQRTVALGELFDCSKFTASDCDGGPECGIDRFSEATKRVTIRTTAGGVVMKRTMNFQTGEIAPVGADDLASDSDTPSAQLKRPAPTGSETSHDRPRAERRRWVQVVLAGVVVVTAGTVAFLTLAFVLIRGQPVTTANLPPPMARPPKLSS